MGEIYGFHCSNCGYDYEVEEGFGFFFNVANKNTINRIQAGDYGKEAFEAFNKNAFTTINGYERCIFICECGNWRVAPDLSIYEPISVEDAEMRYKDKFDKDTPESRSTTRTYSINGRTYMVGYKLAYQHKYYCDKCHKEMKRVEEPYGYIRKHGLKCPECGTINLGWDAGDWE